ncbi:MAG: ATP-dependent helicase [Patescibacteria group bacterium]
MAEKIILNKKQREAVEYADGPLLVVAGPGTGKTRTLTEKIRYLLAEKDIDSQNILALTFTEKAAEEMLSRIDQVMPLGYEEPWLSTFHSFCDRILRESGIEIGLDPSFEILTSSEQWIFLHEHLFELDLDYYLPLGNPSKFISVLLNFFSRLQDEYVEVEEFEKFVQSSSSKLEKDTAEEADIERIEKLKELANAYKKYQNLKVAHSVMDFGDLISWTIKLFRQCPSVLQDYQQQFQHILVDEFQDTNHAQYQLVKLLAPTEDNPNLVVCGDDSQSIYRFRGTSLTNILNFKQDYPNAETIILNRDYRNPQPVISRVTQLVKHNEPNTLESKLSIDKNLEAVDSSSDSGRDSVTVLAEQTVEEEADVVVETVKKLAEKDDYQWRDFAILARANSHLDPFVAAFKRAGIPYQLLGNRGLFDQPEIRELISFCRVVTDVNAGTALFEFLNSSVFSIDSAVLANALSLSHRKKKPFWEILQSIDDSNLSTALQYISRARKQLNKLPSQLLYDFVMDSGFVKRFLTVDSIENQLRVKNLNLFFDQIKKFESKFENATLPEFVNYIDLMVEAGENPAQAEIEDIDTVNLLTVHAAKGLEWPVVFLVNLIAGRFPTRRRSRTLEVPEELVKDQLPEVDVHIQEERRLFYVGCTRASEKLFLTWAKDYGGKTTRKPSAFISELDLDAEKDLDEQSKKDNFQLSFLGSDTDVDVSSIPREKYSPEYVSYSQIETFELCPLKYKYRYVLGVPTLPHHALSFGQTIHRTLRDFHRADLFSEKDLDYLLELYGNHWIEEGYDSEQHREKRFAEGKQLLTTYYNSYQEKLGKPIYLEKKFKLNIDGIPLLGSIDRVDQLENGVEIIDYKTGRVKEQSQVDRDDQLTIYALAARDALGLSSGSLALYFVSGNKKVTTTRTDKDLDEKREELVETLEKIRESKFSAEPGFLCDYCEYRHICPEYKVGS